jgi:hypothetical protein
MDARLYLMSYSSNLTLHECPRKLQLYKLSTIGTTDTIDDSITFTYGHCVGMGIQLVFEGRTETEIIWAMFQRWNVDLFADNPKQNKSFWQAVIAVQKFISLRANGFLNDYELVSYKDKPAVELSFRIGLPNGFRYRGHVDAVLRHKKTGGIVVLEVKTTSQSEINPAMYKNSAQAIGYSIVLDVIEPALSAYEVLYLVYKTKAMEWEILKFPKSYLQRAQWIQELLLDADTIDMYERVGVYPMHGENCISKYGKECKYLQVCTLSTVYLTKPEPAPELLDLNRDTGKPMEYQIELTIQDLITAQLNKEVIA